MSDEQKTTLAAPSPTGAYYAACEAYHSAVLAFQAAEKRRDAALSEMERLEKEMGYDR